MNNEIAGEIRITDKLDSLLRLVAVAVIQGKNQTEQIRLLSQAGLQPKEIAELVGTSSNNVRVRLVELRKRSKIRKSRRNTDVIEGS